MQLCITLPGNVNFADFGEELAVHPAPHPDLPAMGTPFKYFNYAPLCPAPQVDTLLETIPKTFAGSQVMETCGGAALRSAVEALKGGEGGRLHAFLCSLPRRGALHLRLRDVGRPPTDRDQLDSMLPENKEYVALASDAADHQVGPRGAREGGGGRIAGVPGCRQQQDCQLGEVWALPR